MVEPIIKAKLVLDTTGGGVAGAVGGSSSSGGTGMLSAIKDKLTIPITDVLSSIAKGIATLVRASPHLAATMKEFGMGMKMILMPIGETISTLLRPWLLKFNRIAFKFYEDYLNGGLISAIKNAITENPGATAAVAGTLVLGGAALASGISSIGAMLGSAFGLETTAVAGMAGVGLMIPALIGLGAFVLAKAFGHTNFSSGLLAVIGIAGAAIVGPALAIPLVLSGLLILEAATTAQAKLAEWSDKVGLRNSKFDNGFTAEAFIDMIIRPKSETEILSDRSEREFIENAPTIAELQSSTPGGGTYGSGENGPGLSGIFGDSQSGMLADIEAMNAQFGTIPLTAEQAAKDAEARSMPFWTKMKEGFLSLVTGGGSKNAYTGESTGGDSTSMVGAISSLGNATVSTANDTMIPAFQAIGTEIDVEIGKTATLNKDLEDLPNIERTITYKTVFL